MAKRDRPLGSSAAFWALPGVAGIALVLWQLTPIGGIMGHDFYHYLARAYAGAVHFWQNGFAVPHYTPTLCGGLPVFADPQSMYYSLPQWLTFVMDPLAAVLVTHFVFYGLGYWGFYRFLRDVVEAARELSHWGALLFVLNGFSFEHLLVGHLTHHSYLLFPWLLRVAMVPGPDFWKRAGLLSLILIYTFYSGGTHMIVVFVAGALLLLPWCISRGARRGDLKETGALVLLSAVLVLAACSPKLAASAALSPSFLQRPIDSSGLSISTLLKQFFWFDPRTLPNTILFGKWHFGPWEYVGFMSKMLILGVPVLLVSLLLRMTRARFLLVSSYIAVIYAIGWIGAAKHAEHGLWLLRDYHNPIKIYGAFVPFLIVAAVVSVRWIASFKGWLPTTPWVRATLFGMASLMALAEFAVSSRYFVSNPLVYNFRYDPNLWRELRKVGHLPEVTQVTDQYRSDVDGIARGETSLKCFEPMFGYRREVMKADLVAGSPLTLREGRFNFTHPGCLVYPGHFQCKRWDRVPASEEGNLRRFVRGDSGAWSVPLWQTGLLRVGLLSTLLSVLLASGVYSRLAARKPAEATA
jgi:hypothetical protein